MPRSHGGGSESQSLLLYRCGCINRCRSISGRSGGCGGWWFDGISGCRGEGGGGRHLNRLGLGHGSGAGSGARRSETRFWGNGRGIRRDGGGHGWRIGQRCGHRPGRGGARGGNFQGRRPSGRQHEIDLRRGRNYQNFRQPRRRKWIQPAGWEPENQDDVSNQQQVDGEGNNGKKIPGRFLYPVVTPQVFPREDPFTPKDFDDFSISFFIPVSRNPIFIII